LALVEVEEKRFQFYVDYKAKLNGSRVEYVNPRGTSKICSRCGGKIAPNEKICPSCGIGRHVNACLNILKMCGVQAPVTRPQMTPDSGTGEVHKSYGLVNSLPYCMSMKKFLSFGSI